ncbi:hypothetical protein NEMBOFW57_007822 [Staphylotrichum longicolle]|uniref:RRM domain-containing protein n=1 Tax=Staphylotrichum longicolle TaxID=669026 RepID=A0AAD4EVU1_9PEZI|nr:hypothetical protein NEMBOFW57_007822 [Staphylotrichum longicolle]
MDVQAQRLVDHLVASGIRWGDLYREATTKAFFADHGTIQERWYSTIVSEMEWRGAENNKILSSEKRQVGIEQCQGALGPEVNEFVLVSLFQSRLPSCKSAKIMTVAMTGQSRGYGAVWFSEESDQQRALAEIQGVYCGSAAAGSRKTETR